MSPLPEPVFYLQLYRDGELAEHALKRLRKSYPNARVLLQSDGDANPAYDDLALRYNCAYFVGKRLYAHDQGGKMLQRMLNDYLCGPGEWLIKIDTDTRIDRPFTTLPTLPAIYGNPLRQGPPQGGCVIIPRKIAIGLRKSRIFLDQRLLDAEGSWGARMCRSFLEEQLKATGCVAFEWTLYWGCNELKIPVFPHPEIHATWKQGHVNESCRYAAVHPDKFLHVEDATVHNECTATHAQASNIYLKAVHQVP